MLIFNESKILNLELIENQTQEIVVLLFGDENYQTDIKIKLTGKNSNIKVTGLYFAKNGQKIDNKIEVEHLAPNCSSEILYKGVAKDLKTTVSWIGNVIIRETAIETSTYEENRNLLLSKGSKVLSEPNLEILTGDIKGAGHASATSRFDDKELFYLQSRGISKDDAKKLVVNGFFHSVLDKLVNSSEINANEINDSLINDVKQKIDELL